MGLPDTAKRLDFSESTNPLGMPVSVKRALADPEVWIRCPDPDCDKLTKKLALRDGAASDRFVCGSGTDDLLRRIILAVRPKKALICVPAKDVYRRTLMSMGCSVTELQLSPENNFVVTSVIADHISDDTDMVMISTPNDPTGEPVTPYTMGMIADRCRVTHTFLVCDESLMDFVQRSRRFSRRRTVGAYEAVLRSFSEVYCLGGLPLSCAVFGDSRIAARVRAAGAHMSISGPAQAAVSAAIDEPDLLRRTKKTVTAERRYLSEQLTRMGLLVYPSETNVLLFRCELPLDELLLKRGIVIRSCADYPGLDGTYFRIALRCHRDNERLVREIRRILQ